MNENEISNAEEVAMQKYDNGKWLDSIGDLKNLLKLADPAKCSELNMDIGWNKWKLRLKDEAMEIAVAVLANEESTVTARASAHSLLSLYNSEMPDRKSEASEHARLAQELTSPNSGLRYLINLNSCLIAQGNIGELERAEQIFQKVSAGNEQLEKSDDLVIAQKAKHQRAKNGYNFVSKVLMPQDRLDEAAEELIENVIPRYIAVDAPTDLAAAYHQLSVVCRKQKNLAEALYYEEMSLALWEKHSDDPNRVVQAKKNVDDIKAEMQESCDQEQGIALDGPKKKILARDKK